MLKWQILNSWQLNQVQVYYFTLFKEKLINTAHRNAEIQNYKQKLAREQQELMMYSDQSSQWAFELVTVMCRYKLALAIC